MNPSYSIKAINSNLFIRNKDCEKLEGELKKEYAENRNELNRLKIDGRNTYKWLLRKEEQKVKTKGPDQEQLKAQAIVSLIFIFIKLDQLR